jgi:hypothetical protein
MPRAPPRCSLKTINIGKNTAQLEYPARTMCLTHSRCRSEQRDACVPGGDLLSIRIRRDDRSRVSSALVLYTLDEEEYPLVFSQYEQRVQSRDSSCRNPTCRQSNCSEQRCHAGESRQIRHVYIIKESTYCPSRRPGKREAEDQAGRCQLQSMPDNHCGDIRRCCTDGYPHSNLAAALSHRIRQNSVQTGVIFSRGMRSAIEPRRRVRPARPALFLLGHQRDHFRGAASKLSCLTNKRW